MKALVYAGDRKVEISNVELAFDDTADVLVDVLRTGICGTDVGAVAHGRPKLPPGVVLGHEFVGRRCDTGALVVGNPIISCRNCSVCQSGMTHLCSKRQVLGVHRPGAFASRVAVPAGNLVEVEHLTHAQAALVDPLATALHAWRLVRRPCRRVAVIGAGAIGLCAVAILKAAEVEEIFASDVVAERLEFAQRLGATEVGLAPDGEFDAVIDAVGTEETRRIAASILRPGGVAVLVGLHAAEIVLAAGPLIGGERTLQGSFAYTEAEFIEASRMASMLDTSWVQEITFGAAADTLNAMVAGQLGAGGIKVHVCIGE